MGGSKVGTDSERLCTSSMEELTAELPMLALTFTRKARPARCSTPQPFDSECPLHAGAGKCSAAGLSKSNMELWPDQSHTVPALRM